MTAEDIFLKKLNIVKSATKYNFQPFTHRTGKNLKNSLQQPTNILNQLKSSKMVKEVEIYPPVNLTRKNTFYTPRGYRHHKIARRELEHTSGIRDITLGFAYGYEDYKITVIYEPNMSLQDKKSYKPDAYISLHSLKNKKYEFLLEFERTRSMRAILDEKVTKCENLDFEKNGLNPNTKILFVYSHEVFDVYNRPIEYQKSLTDALEETAKNLSLELDDKYRTMAYHKFPKLNEEVWYRGGEQVKLINI